MAELPASCHVCGLTLVSSPHLARSYHHLFPVQPFREVPAAELPSLQVRRPENPKILNPNSEILTLKP